MEGEFISNVVVLWCIHQEQSHCSRFKMFLNDIKTLFKLGSHSFHHRFGKVSLLFMIKVHVNLEVSDGDGSKVTELAHVLGRWCHVV